MSTTNSRPVISNVGHKYLRLHLTPDLGPIRLRKLLDYFKSVDRIMNATQAELTCVEGIGPKIAKSITQGPDAKQVGIEIERAERCGGRIYCVADDDYPASLLQIPDPPTCLYVKGAIEPADAVSVGVVGTRRCSRYGLEQAERFSELLAGAGFTIVSGLARGIDGAAHRGALAAGGRTIAVLGHGLGQVYPPEHQELASRIVQTGSGALMSELAVNIGPDPKNFPRRNRIVVGLSLGVIIVEAGKRSGALITARLANEYNREVFAVPGRIDDVERTVGTNGLIRDGKAKLITCLDDVLDELQEVGEIMRASTGLGAAKPAETSTPTPQKAPAGFRQSPSLKTNLSFEEQSALSAVMDGEEDIDSISIRTNLESSRLLAAMTTLQLRGLIKQVPGGRFIPRERSIA